MSKAESSPRFGLVENCKIIKVDIFNDSTFPITTPLSRSGAFLNFEKQASLLGNPVDKIANLFEAKVQYLGK